jgi:uncharacterized protein YndB with AHSA1/START domain
MSSETQHVAKWELTCWRGGRGRSRLVSLEMWHVTNEDSLEERKREEWVGELGNMACHKTGTHLLEGREREVLEVRQQP